MAFDASRCSHEQMTSVVFGYNNDIEFLPEAVLSCRSRKPLDLFSKYYWDPAPTGKECHS